MIRKVQEEQRRVRGTAWKSQKQAESERTAVREDIKRAQKTAAQDKAKLTEQAQKLEQACKNLEEQTRLSDEAVRKLEGKCGKAGDSVRFSTKEFDEAERRIREETKTSSTFKVCEKGYSVRQRSVIKSSRQPGSANPQQHQIDIRTDL